MLDLRHILAAALFVSTAAAANRHQTFAELAADADRVLIGTVGSQASHWGDDAHIYTDFLVYPDVSLKGADDGAVVVHVLGGTVGDTTMTVSDGPELPSRERVILFLKAEGGRFVIVGRSAGAISARSSAADAAVESVVGAAERAAGVRLVAKRLTATAVLNRARAGNPATGAAAPRATTQTGCYGVDGAKWSSNSAGYQIGSTIPADWTASIDASTATWNAVNAGFRLVNDASAVNELSYKDLVAAYGSSYSNTFAVTTTWSSNSTGRIVKATIEFNTKWPWSTSGEANMADVQNIFTHEFGHWLRLVDIYSPDSCGDVTMWGAASFGETKKRTLEQADIDGFLSLYGEAAAPPAPTPAPTPAPPPAPANVTAPTLTSPAYRAMDVSTTPTLAWTPAANASSYDVYFGQDSGQPLVATVTGTTCQVGPLTPGETYYWRVVAKNAAGSASSPVSAFRVSPAAP